MKTIKNTFSILCLIFFSITILKAQSGAVTSGGGANGTNGSMSFSIGQINCITTSGTGGTITQGLQQPLEIFITT